MNTIETDVVILGAGTAGINARRAVTRAGKRWVVVEGIVYGTMCARVGCMPSKLLIAAAERRHEMLHAERFGVRAGEVTVDGSAVLERVRRERDRFVGFVLEANERLPKEQNLFGSARFVGPTSVVVGGHTRVDAKAVVIATGSTPMVPPLFAALGDRLDTNDTIFERSELPKSVAVIGTGVIGLELGQALHRLGVRTLLFSRAGHFAGLRDPAVHEAAKAALTGELDVRIGEVTAAEVVAGGVRLGWREAGADKSDTFERVLVATGRHAATAGLDLGVAGIACDGRGVPLFDAATLQCGDLPVFVAGDVTGAHPVLHEAIDDGRIAGTNAASFPDVRAPARRVPLAITFCDPNVAVVGERWAAEHAVGHVDYTRQGRARIMGRNVGLVHLYARRSDRRLIGAEMCGPRVEHTAHLIAWAIQSRLTVDEALARPFYHPVIEEGIRTALENLERDLDAGERPGAVDITAVDHLGIRVLDAARSEAFYAQLGFAVVARHEAAKVVILRNAAGVEINLIVNADPAFDGTNALMDDGLPKRAGYTHVALAVRSIEATVQALAALGIPLSGAPVRLGDGTSLFIRDPDKNVVELRASSS